MQFLSKFFFNNERSHARTRDRCNVSTVYAQLRIFYRCTKQIKFSIEFIRATYRVSFTKVRGI